MDEHQRSPSRATREALLSWDEAHRVDYPWRRGGADPYRVLVAEVMLQQTQASRVGEAFDRFVRVFPTIEALAGASRADVVRAWSGLGYNRRAVALHEAARTVVRELGGRLPREAATLVTLPGVGPYTAAAVSAIGFGEPVAAVDTNVRRVMARVVFGAEPGEVPDASLRQAAGRWLDRRRPAAWNQAVMDLGREVCRAATPRCDACPLRHRCAFRAGGRRARPAGRGQPPFEGSARQARGRIVEELRARDRATPAALARATGLPAGLVDRAIASLVTEGMLEWVGRSVRLHRGEAIPSPYQTRDARSGALPPT